MMARYRCMNILDHGYAGTLRTPPGRAEAQDWESSNFFVIFNTDFDQTDFISLASLLSRRFAQKLTLPLFRAPPAGSTGRRVANAAPKSAAYKDTLTCCIIICTRDAGYPQSARRIHRERAHTTRLPLRRKTCDGRRCDARSTRRAAGTRAPPQNTRRAHRMRILDARRRLASRNGAGVGGVAIASTRSSRPRPRPRYSRDHPSRLRLV